jgi:peptidoglycan/xylan/chitin deacetylase (PgdA/CDA1 family)
MKRNFIIFGFIGLSLISLLFFAVSPNSKVKINGEDGILTLAFDDGFKSQYEIVFKEMQEYGYRGSLFLVANWTGLFEGKELMTFQEARKMQSGGWEIGSHSLTHNFHNRLTKLSDEELENELKKSKEILEERGFEIKPDFAT